MSHIGIDVLGDFLLPHDTYDDVSHASRLVICCAGLTIFGLAAVWLLLGALDEGARRTQADRGRDVRISLPVMRYVAFVVSGALALLVAMEFTDVALAGRSIDDASDLLGGSIPLGAGVLGAVAAAFAFASWRVAGWALSVERAVLRAIGAWRARRARRPDAAATCARRSRPAARPTPARTRASKRGPPILTA